MSAAKSKTVDWLESYATVRHEWHETGRGGRVVHHRRIGVVEGLFNTDGIDCEGRADLTIDLHVELKTSLPKEELARRISRAWAVLRQQHVLLSARVTQAKNLSPGVDVYEAEDWLYVFEPSANVQELLAEAEKHMVFVEDHYPDARSEDFFIHLLNSSRGIDPFTCLSRLYVMPLISQGQGLYSARFMFIVAHEIVDGLTSMRWMSSFIEILNRTDPQLSSASQRLCREPANPRLPPAQESLYPSRGTNEARRRWAWLITRIFRHTEKAPPASFQNPLRRRASLSKAEELPRKFPDIIDYSRGPPLNTYPVRPLLSAASSQRLAQLCREAKISIGSGCFALVALVMMIFEEKRHPDVPGHERLPFVGSFPVNPRPLLDGTPTTGKEDNLMLAFSEGIALPFLTSDLNLEGRFRLLGKQAHRQLRQYQKRPRTALQRIELGARSPDQLLRSCTWRPWSVSK